MKSELNKPIIPVLLGGDLNAYSVARAFFEGCGLISYVFSAARLGITDNAPFIKLRVVEGLGEVDTLVPALIGFAREHSDAELLLVPCADWYMELVQFARERLLGHFSFNIPSFEIWRVASDKISFYRLLRRFSIAYPHFAPISANDKISAKCMSLRPPFVLKPADSAQFHRCKIKDKQKIYLLDDLSQVRRRAEDIFAEGYSSRLLVQEYLTDGQDKSSFVLTTYSTVSGRVVMACFAEVILEERTPTARGNYSALLTRPLTPICRRIIDMLDDIGYQGFANFDIIKKDGREMCLELNPRQGRSCDYLRAAGINIAKLLIRDIGHEKIEYNADYKAVLWHAVPLFTVKRYARRDASYERMTRLIRAGRASFAFMPSVGIKRLIYDKLHAVRQHKKFKMNIGGNS